jgi:hypothetical protein
VLATLAAAFAVAAPGQQPPLTLTVDRDRLEIPDPGNEGAEVRFEVTPPPTIRDRDSIPHCRNGRFDRADLAEGRIECSGDIFTPGSNNGRWIAEFHAAGRYEAVALRLQRGGPRTTSNILTLVAVDPCRLTSDVVRLIPRMAWLRGEPIKCQGGGNGLVRLRGADGSAIALEAPGVSWLYNTNRIRPMCRRPGSCTPMLFLVGSCAELQRCRKVDNTYRLGARLGRFVALAGAPYVAVGSTEPAQVSLVHRNRATRVRVGKGSVVVFHRLAVTQLQGHILLACPHRPTLRCLRRIRYRIGRAVFKGKPMRAGQSAIFRRR